MKLVNKIILTKKWAKDSLLKIVLTVHAINIYATESKTQRNATWFIVSSNITVKLLNFL